MTKFPEASQIAEIVNREKGAMPLDDHFKLSTGQKRKRRAALKATKKNDKRAKNNKRKGQAIPDDFDESEGLDPLCYDD